MERGELCHSQYRGLLLADYMQDIDAAKSNARGVVVRSLDLSPGFGDYGMGFMPLKATVNPE